MKRTMLVLALTTAAAACGDRYADAPRLPEYQGLALGISQDSAVAVADALGLRLSCTARYDPTNGAELTVCATPEESGQTAIENTHISAAFDASGRLQAALVARPAGAGAGPWLDSLFRRWGEPQEVHGALHRWYIDDWMVEADTLVAGWQVAISDTTWNRRLNALE
jgi:hypothetical protein